MRRLRRHKSSAAERVRRRLRGLQSFRVGCRSAASDLWRLRRLKSSPTSLCGAAARRRASSWSPFSLSTQQPPNPLPPRPAPPGRHPGPRAHPPPKRACARPHSRRQISRGTQREIPAAAPHINLSRIGPAGGCGVMQCHQHAAGPVAKGCVLIFVSGLEVGTVGHTHGSGQILKLDPTM